MKDWKNFIIPFVSIILVHRLVLLFINDPQGMIYNDAFHHAYIGILILFIIGLMYHIKKKINMIFFGLGLGMLIDEIFLFFSKGNGYQKYWNNLSIYGTFILMITIIIIYFAFGYIRKIKSSS